jgi:hypothetical protein
MTVLLKNAIKQAEQKAKLFPRFWEFWKSKSNKERKEIYKKVFGREIMLEMHKEEYAHLFSLDEIVEIMDFCEV